MTLDVYSGLFSDDLDRVAERLNDAAMASRGTATGATVVGLDGHRAIRRVD